MRAMLCHVGLHRWRVSRVQGLGYVYVVTSRCLRCGRSRERSRWG